MLSAAVVIGAFKVRWMSEKLRRREIFRIIKRVPVRREKEERKQDLSAYRIAHLTVPCPSHMKTYRIYPAIRRVFLSL